jgi:hypothetical protein
METITAAKWQEGVTLKNLSTAAKAENHGYLQEE